MKLLSFLLVYYIGLSSLWSYTDESHFSTTFNTTRSFRVFTPINYNEGNLSRRYPVIYYFHGCGGSYQQSGTYRYQDYGLLAPIAINRSYDSDYEFANNADFENLASAKDVIIIAVDGKIDELPAGCKVYFPTLADSWEGNYYNFSAYLKELIPVVDSRYNTKDGAQFRAITGLSMGGHMAIWIAATNPDLFSSGSQFCHSPNFYTVGDPTYQTTIDIKELWRNLRGLPFRHATTDRDYLRYYTDELFSIFNGAGFDNEYYLADYCHHAAARADLQIDFHLRNFADPPKNLSCFSYLNLYPNFEIRGYQVASEKVGNGWIYLHNVTSSGFGLYTRKRMPWGNSLPGFEITVTTPSAYLPNTSYTLSRYSYRDGLFSQQRITTDILGRLSITSNGGAGEEIGIVGPDIQPPVFILVDTINENIYLQDQIETAISAEIINLSPIPQTLDFLVSTENSKILSIISPPNPVTIPALSKIKIDTLVVLKGTYLGSPGNTGYLKIKPLIRGVLLDREDIVQVNIKAMNLKLEPSGIKIFDGRSENLAVFKYEWNEWDNPISSQIIREGYGNGNGIPEMGETFSIWLHPNTVFDFSDSSTWHPATLIQIEGSPDIEMKEIIHYSLSTGRDVRSAQISLKRTPTFNDPVRIPMQVELLKVQPLKDDCHRPTADNFCYFYQEILLHHDGTLQISP